MVLTLGTKLVGFGHMLLKGTAHPKMKIMLSFSHPQVAQEDIFKNVGKPNS